MARLGPVTVRRPAEERPDVMRMCNLTFTVDAHIWEGERDPLTETFLGEDFLRWGRALDGTPTLTVRRDPADHGSDFLVVRPGWTLIRWDDGALSAHSPISLGRLFRPVPGEN